jgi:hypothetical protein
MSQTTLEVAGQTFRSGGVSASFFDIPAGLSTCTEVVVGTCTVTDCSALIDAGVPPNGVQVSAGSLTFTGLADGGVTLSPGLGGTYSQTFTGAVFVEGMPLGVSATGAEVPAFAAQVVAPARARVTAPQCPQGTCPETSKSVGFAVSWTGGSGDVAVKVISSGVRVECLYSASAGSGAVPPAALATLPAGMALLYVSTQSRVTVQAGAFPVKVSAEESTILSLPLVP